MFFDPLDALLQRHSVFPVILVGRWRRQLLSREKRVELTLPLAAFLGRSGIPCGNSGLFLGLVLGAQAVVFRLIFLAQIQHGDHQSEDDELLLLSQDDEPESLLGDGDGQS